MQQIGTEIAIKWDDGAESFIALDSLRRACPCAGCKGEVDIMGQLHIGPAQKLSPQAFELAAIETVGSYAIQPIWRDGHSSGLYPYAYLRSLTKP